VNLALVAVTITGLLDFRRDSGSVRAGRSRFDSRATRPSVLEAIAFLFVAYTGYGRIATLGEEVRDPVDHPAGGDRDAGITAVLYTRVAWGVDRMWTGPVRAETASSPSSPDLTGGWVVTVAAAAAMAGVLLNLVLGLSRVWLAMGRRGDMPSALGRVTDGSPGRRSWSPAR
jgi:basic amino acid/polyamine antiporter, APA family